MGAGSKVDEETASKDSLKSAPKSSFFSVSQLGSMPHVQDSCFEASTIAREVVMSTQLTGRVVVQGRICLVRAPVRRRSNMG